MKRNWREIALVVSYHLLGAFLLGGLLYDLFIGRPG